MSNKKIGIIKYVLLYPTATNKQVAKVVGCSAKYVSKVRSNSGTPKEVFLKDKIKKESNRSVLLAEASRLTSQERNKEYGDPIDNMTHIADIFNAITGHNIKPSEVPIFHIATKLARKRTSPLKKDHYVDIMAYMGIAYECEMEEK